MEIIKLKKVFQFKDRWLQRKLNSYASYSKHSAISLHKQDVEPPMEEMYIVGLL
jgi:hypothetical protein